MISTRDDLHLFTESNTDRQGLHVEAGVQQAAHLEQRLESVSGLHEALAGPGLVRGLVTADLGHPL